MRTALVHVHIRLIELRERARNDDRGDTVERVIGYGLGAVAAVAVMGLLYTAVTGAIGRINWGF